MNAHPRLHVSMQEAAAILGVHRQTLWRMQRDKQIKTTKIRGRRLVPMAELERLAAEGTTPPNTTAKLHDPMHGEQPAERGPVGVPARKAQRKRKLSPGSS